MINPTWGWFYRLMLTSGSKNFRLIQRCMALILLIGQWASGIPHPKRDKVPSDMLTCSVDGRRHHHKYP